MGWSDFSRDINSPLGDIWGGVSGGTDTVSKPNSWLSNALHGLFANIEEVHSQAENTDSYFEMKKRESAYDIDAEQILAVQQRTSKGFTIIDINPGLLDIANYPVNVPFDFLISGAGFMSTNDPNDSAKEAGLNLGINAFFRTVQIDTPGTWVKVEYLNENNDLQNLNAFQNNASLTNYVPHVEPKYNDATPNGVFDFVTGITVQNFDHFSREKMFLTINDQNSIPHIVHSGDSFEGYFNTLYLTLNKGCPKIRVTIGYNSKKFEDRNYLNINSRLSIAGSRSFFENLDSVISPFTLNDIDFSGALRQPNMPGVTSTSSPGSTAIKLVSCPVTYGNRGYGVLWLENVFYNFLISSGPNGHIRFGLYVGINPPTTFDTNRKRVHSALLFAKANVTLDGVNFTYGDSFSKGFNEPKRIVIPSGWGLWLLLEYSSSSTTTMSYSFNLDGYSYGDLVTANPTDSAWNVAPIVTKFVTDSSFVNDFAMKQRIKA